MLASFRVSFLPFKNKNILYIKIQVFRFCLRQSGPYWCTATSRYNDYLGAPLLRMSPTPNPPKPNPAYSSARLLLAGA